MKLALFADVHANLEALEACMAHAAEEGAERHAFLGDLVGYGADPGPVLELVSASLARGALERYAQLFMEAAGAETIHGISHLRVAGGIGSTLQNLDHSANGEDDEIEVMYSGVIRQADEGGRLDAAALQVGSRTGETSSCDVQGGLNSFNQMKATA